MKQTKKIILIIIIIIIGIIVGDSLQALLFNNSPIIKIKINLTDSNIKYIDKGLVVNHYYCNNNTEKTVFKGTNYNCLSNVENKKIKTIIDKTLNTQDFACLDVIEDFYQDENYIYYFNCAKGYAIVVVYEDETEEKVEDALKKGTITISDLDKYNITYGKREIKNN